MTATCALCGEPMPAGEEMFKYHGYSGPCPKPPLDKGLGTQPERQEQSSGGVEPIEAEAARILRQAYGRLVTPDDDGSFYAVIREFPGCIATSDTASEALANLESVAESWLLAELDRGHNIPGPTPFEWPRGASRAAYALRPISGPDTSLRERCQAVVNTMQRDAMLRQGSSVETLMAFVVAETGRTGDPSLADALPLCLYFVSDTDREEFMAAVREWKPGMITRKLP